MTDKAVERLRGLAEQLKPGNLTGVVMYLSVLTVGELSDLRSSLAALEEKERVPCDGLHPCLQPEMACGRCERQRAIGEQVDLMAENATLKTALQAAGKALLRYGEHRTHCAWFKTNKCDCGLDKALTLIEAAKESTDDA